MKIWILSILLVTATANAFAAKLGPLASKPDWRQLDAYQKTITREDFVWLLDNVYAPHDAARGVISMRRDSAKIRTGGTPYVLEFASNSKNAQPIPRTWKARGQLPSTPDSKPLAGLKIAIDPGHIGGDWAKIEERWFQIGNSKPVTEGDLTLDVAKLLVPRLKALGAEVFLVRSKTEPVTSLRPNKLRTEARKSLQQSGSSITDFSLRKESERLFYRVGEIRQRARLVNERIRPDLVLCLHFNAEAWGDAANPSLTDKDHLHFLVTGAFSADELSFDDQRFTMLEKLLSRSFPEEAAVTQSVASSMAKRSNLPPFEYHGNNAVNVGGNPYIWGRNLLANRLYQCPVVFVEAYVMNSREVFARIQAGDYTGTRKFGGIARKSIYREYADSLVEGLVNYYSKRQP